MKKILTVLTLSLTALMSTVSVAGPYFDRDNSHDFPQARKERGYDRNHNDDNEQMRSEQRRMREERGVQRLKQHRWQAGYVMPQHYRSNGYKVEYRDHNLPKPDRNQQWYKINNDYILVNSDTNDIIRIVGF
ncbi:RcnB family protein [Acinetobacter ursingii]|uniref:RcnB family protein n=1 Tax=Acinetobacter ursingii TaxID=108980 RepID=UPI0005CAF046|nr:RcnB family protein [Acinetobacter ursingii]MCU4587811.1 RcnB family protein [Acinetobacter ursingii]